VAQKLADPETTSIHVVALPEEMPLEEAAEVLERLRGELRLPIGGLIVNQCRPAPPPGAAAAVGSLRGTDAARRELALAAGRALGWLRIQEEGIAALERRVGMVARRLPLIAAEPFGRAEVERLSREIEVA
jgi:anion-transporting  ArsA/GET3 family ATPase